MFPFAYLSDQIDTWNSSPGMISSPRKLWEGGAK